MGVKDRFQNFVWDNLTPKNIKNQVESNRTQLVETKRLLAEAKKGLFDDAFPESIKNGKVSPFHNLFSRFTRVSHQWKAGLRDYRAMLTDPIIAGALEVMCDDAYQYNAQNNKIVWTNIKDKENQKLCEELFEKLSLDDSIWEWGYNTILVGEKRYKVNFENDNFSGGIHSLNTNPKWIENIEPLEKEGELIGFIGTGGDLFHPWEFLIQKMPSSASILEYEPRAKKIKMDDNKEYENTYRPGVSVLESSRRHWRNLRLIEDSLVLARLERAPVRRMIMFNCGTQAPKDAVETIEFYRSLLNDDRAFSFNEGLEVDYGRSAYASDIFIPVQGNVNSINIQDLTKDFDAGRILDVKYFKDKLFASLKVPQGYLGFQSENPSSFGSDSALVRLEIRYARTIKKIKRATISFLKDLCILHLLSLGKKFDPADILIEMEIISTAEEEERNSAIEKATRSFQGLFQVFDRVQGVNMDKEYLMKYLFTTVLHLPGFEVDKFIKKAPVEGDTETPDVKGGKRFASFKHHHAYFKEWLGQDEESKSSQYKLVELAEPLTVEEMKFLIESKSDDVDFEIDLNDYNFTTAVKQDYDREIVPSIILNEHLSDMGLNTYMLMSDKVNFSELVSNIDTGIGCLEDSGFNFVLPESVPAFFRAMILQEQVILRDKSEDK